SKKNPCVGTYRSLLFSNGIISKLPPTPRFAFRRHRTGQSRVLTAPFSPCMIGSSAGLQKSVPRRESGSPTPLAKEFPDDQEQGTHDGHLLRLGSARMF